MKFPPTTRCNVQFPVTQYSTLQGPVLPSSSNLLESLASQYIRPQKMLFSSSFFLLATATLVSFQSRFTSVRAHHQSHLSPDELFDDESSSQAHLSADTVDHLARNMSAVANGRVIFSEPPSTIIVPGTHLTYEKTTIDFENLPLNGGVLAKTILISPDPYMRGKLKASGPGTFQLGSP